MSDTVRAWIRADGGGLRATDVPAPVPGEDAVVIAVEAAGLDDDEATCSPGATAVGVVVAAGARAEGWIGRRVGVGPRLPCGECEVCRRGGVAACPTARRSGREHAGTLVERIEAPARWVTALDRELAVPGPAAAVVVGDAALAYALYARAGVGPREATVVVGDDAVARFLVEILAAKGSPAVLVGGDDDERSDIDRVGSALADAGHRAKPRRIFASSFRRAPPTERRGDARRRALALAGARSLVVVRADETRSRPLTLPEGALAREVTVHGVAGAHPDLVVEVAALVVRGELDVAGGTTTIARAVDAGSASGSASGSAPGSAPGSDRARVAVLPLSE